MASLTSNFNHQPTSNNTGNGSNINNNNGMSTGTSGGGQGSREYCLRWNNHQPNMVSYFGNLYSNESFVDVTLVSSEGKKLLAHKLVLMSMSPYFQHVFENNPCKHPIVILKDVAMADLQTIVSFIYNGEVNISQDRINAILMTANSLQVKGLAEVPADELKRVSSVVGDSSSHSTKSHPIPPLTTSTSWADNHHDGSDIPRKKLRKSVSATPSYGPSNTNGQDYTSSIDSGVGVSVNRSLDDGPIEEISVLQKRTSLPAPPPLLPKSRSLDHTLHRDRNQDSEMNSVARDRHSYDDSSVDLDRGYELELADTKIEAISDDGEIEFLEEEDAEYDEEESYANYEDDDNNGSMEHYEMSPQNIASNKRQCKPQTSTTTSSTSIPPKRETLRVSSAAGERRRRGRPLLRQPRIKRSDNESLPEGGRELYGGELYSTREHLGGDGEHSNDSNSQPSHGPGPTTTTTTISEDEETNPSRDEESKQPQYSSSSSIQKSNLPILRVSQCSPTPPSSPQHPPSTPPPPIKDEKQPVIVSNKSFPVSSSSIINLSSNSQSHITSHTTLLTVPNVDEAQSSSSHGHGSHLVKQISQPHLPSHTVIPLGGITTGNPVIRRQYSTPIPGQQSRIIQSFKHETVLQSLHSDRLYKEEDSKTYIIDVVPSPSSSSNVRDNESPPYQRRELKKAISSEQSLPSAQSSSNSFSREDSMNEEASCSTSVGGSVDDGLPVNRSGHCPALRPGPALGCNFCWNSVDSCGRILRRKTKYHCPECHINLCIVPCFQEYHEKSDKKKKPRSKLGLPKPSSM